MPVTCIVVGCGSRSNRDLLHYFRIPAVRNSVHYPHITILSRKRRDMWIAAIKRDDLTESILKNQRICSRHFITGKPSALNDENHPDWVPSKHMGHKFQAYLKRKSDVGRKIRADKRSKLSIQACEQSELTDSDDDENPDQPDSDSCLSVSLNKNVEGNVSDKKDKASMAARKNKLLSHKKYVGARKRVPGVEKPLNSQLQGMILDPDRAEASESSSDDDSSLSMQKWSKDKLIDYIKLLKIENKSLRAERRNVEVVNKIKENSHNWTDFEVWKAARVTSLTTKSELRHHHHNKNRQHKYSSSHFKNDIPSAAERTFAEQSVGTSSEEGSADQPAVKNEDEHDDATNTQESTKDTYNEMENGS